MKIMREHLDLFLIVIFDICKGRRFYARESLTIYIFMKQNKHGEGENKGEI